MSTAQSGPIEDYVFLIHDVLAAYTRGTADHSRSDTRDLLEQAGRFFGEVWAPLYPAGDAGCRLENGTVRTPEGFPEAYRSYCGPAGMGSAQNPMMPKRRLERSSWASGSLPIPQTRHCHCMPG
jgi:hypothetical protein